MPCTPGSNSINITPAPGIPLPGFGLPFSPIQIPLPNIDLPTDLLEDFLELLSQLGALFPSGLFKPNPDFGMKSVLDFIANLLNQLAPFLSFYNFIMALLNLIVCIIEVLCAIPNPFAIAFKLKKLFTECLPPFLQMFPWLALIAMILALLLLILALITYIIETIIAIIAELIANLVAIGKAIQLNDATAQLAIAQKIASLLCIIENILAILIAIAAILAVIQALMAFAGLAICDDGDEEGCCPPEICPSFLKNNKKISVENGQLIYFSGINADVSGAFPAGLAALLSDAIPALRSERWQVYNTDSNSATPISLIVTPTTPVFFGGQTFYPDQEFPADTPVNRAPYTVDLRFSVNPAAFGHPDILGDRFMRIIDCVAVRKPRIGVLDFQNGLIVNSITNSGTFDLEGGLVFEDDGETPFNLANGDQATLNDFIHEDDQTLIALPASDDGYIFNDVEFDWKPNHPALAGHSLITVGCIPEVNIEKAAQNAVILAEGIDPILNKLQNAPDGQLVPSTGILPNVLGAQQCVQDALDTFRKNITAETAAQFQATMETCLNDLKGQTLAVYCDALIQAVSQFKSTFEVDNDVQFTTRPIIITVTLRDAGGTVISNTIPAECVPDVLEKLKAEVTFGEVTDFTYDGYQDLTAVLTSPVPGSGELTVSFDGNVFSTLVPGADFETPSSIEENIVNYTFVDAVVAPDRRRDVTDVAKDGT